MRQFTRFFLMTLCLVSRSAIAASTSQLNDMTFSYAALSYSSNSMLREEAGNPSGMQNGFSLKWTFSRSPFQDNTYWGLGILVLADVSSTGSLMTYALNAEGKHFFGDGFASGWFVTAATGLAVNVSKGAINEDGAPAAQRPLPTASGRASVGANIVCGGGYSFLLGASGRLGIGPNLTLLVLPGGTIPAVGASATFFF